MAVRDGGRDSPSSPKTTGKKNAMNRSRRRFSPFSPSIPSARIVSDIGGRRTLKEARLHCPTFPTLRSPYSCADKTTQAIHFRRYSNFSSFFPCNVNFLSLITPPFSFGGRPSLLHLAFRLCKRPQGKLTCGGGKERRRK